MKTHLAVALGVLLTAGAGWADEVIDRVLAVVAGDVIMLSDVSAARDLGLVRADNAADPVRGVLSQLIDRALILAEVDRYAPPDPSPEAIADEMRLVTGRFSSPQEFERALTRNGLDRKRLGEALRQNLRIRAYLAQRFSADTQEERQRLVNEWVAGLRRRADITELDAAVP